MSIGNKKYTFDIDAACRYAAANSAGTKSIGKCATYVKKALQAGGLPYIGGYNGCDMGRYCQMYGFKQVYLEFDKNTRNPIGAQKGDIMSVYHGKYGHTCIFDGYRWISDFIQRTCVPYSGGWQLLTFWRWTDNPIFSGYDGANIKPISADSGFAYGSSANSSDYMTFSSNTIGNNIFQNPESNSFQIASINRDISSDNSTDQHTRIYSTNDATIILDELSMPIDNSSDNNETSTDTSTS